MSAEVMALLLAATRLCNEVAESRAAHLWHEDQASGGTSHDDASHYIRRAAKRMTKRPAPEVVDAAIALLPFGLGGTAWGFLAQAQQSAKAA